MKSQSCDIVPGREKRPVIIEFARSLGNPRFFYMQSFPSDVPAIIAWMNNSSVGTGIRESIWFFPVIETLHVLALAVSAGVLMWFDVRLMGWAMKHHPISVVHKQLMPIALVGFIIMFSTGFLLFWSEA